MAKKDLKAAAAGQLEAMQQTAAQRIAAEAAQGAEKDKEKNSAPFTIWTTPENVRRWKAYQKAKKETIKTQAALVELALAEYMAAHPVTDEERAALLKEMEI